MRVDREAMPVDRDLIDRMTDTLAHRGPNDRGTWSDDWISLGSRRLSVIDLSSAGHMPMSNDDGSVHLAYNGELYNFRELKEKFKLEERGYRFHSRTDTEVILRLYEELGIEMVNHLNGMFAISIWDRRLRKLFLVRDHAGIKPLFYQQCRDYFRFGSEIKAILADHRVARKPSLQSLHDFLTFDYVPGPQTAFEGINELPPGNWMSVDVTGETSIHRYWDVAWDADEALTRKSAGSRAYDLMAAAVERQLISDVPVGVMLSGGMDSSAITALMHNFTSEPIHTYSVGFEEQTFNELPHARIVAEQFGTVQNEVVVSPDTVRELLPVYLRYIDEPYADGSAIPTYCLSELAKNDVVVLLSGEGGDEIFAGYETYSAFKVSQWFKRVPSFIRHSVIAPLVNSLPVSDKKLSLEFRMKRFIGGQDLSIPEAHLWWRIVLTEAEKMRLFTPQITEQFVPRQSSRFFIEEFNRTKAGDPLSRIMQIDSSIFLPDDLMIKNDRMTMAHSLEARVPFTDTELIRFMATVPPRIKFPGLRKKSVMRDALKDILPPAIINKKKVGLEMPYSRWLKNELRDLIDVYLAPDKIADRGLFRPEAINGIVDEHMNGHRDNGRALWGLLNYMIWLDIYIP